MLRLLSQMHPFEMIVRSLFLGIGLILLVFFFRILHTNLEIVRTHEKASAEVVSTERIKKRGYRDMSNYLVQFQVPGIDGIQIARLENISARFEVGEQIDVYFKPETADKLTAGGFQAMWFNAAVIGSISLITLALGVRRIRSRSAIRELQTDV